MCWFRTALSLTLVIAMTTAACAASLKALIVDGQNNHQWEMTTPVLKEVLEETGKFVYLRDEVSGQWWTANGYPPRRRLDKWRCHVGLGYNRIVSQHLGIGAEITYFCPMPEPGAGDEVGDPCLIWTVKLTNHTAWTRTISATNYVELALGIGSSGQAHIEPADKGHHVRGRCVIQVDERSRVAPDGLGSRRLLVAGATAAWRLTRGAASGVDLSSRSARRRRSAVLGTGQHQARHR